ncbi:MAG: protein-L-isoaspartate O-methyltransferase [Acidovorax sp.]
MNMPLNTSANTSDPVAQARFNMIEQQIRPWDVLDPDVLDALAVVRREDFVPAAYRGMAFMDTEIPLREDDAEGAMRQGQCMLAPRVEARLLQDLQLQPTDRVLEVGAGSGYMAALLAHRAKEVVTLDIDPAMADLARGNLQRAGVQNVEVRHADGSKGADGTFDVILLSGSVADLPQTLLALLNQGGRLAVVVGSDPMMRATFVRREGDRFESTQPWDVVVPRLLNFPEPSRFVF